MCIASRAYSCGFIEHLPIANRHNPVGPKPKSTDSFYAYNIASASRTPCDCRYMYTVEPSPHPCAVCRSMGDPALDLVGHNGHALRAVPQQQQSEAVTTAAGPSNTTAQPLTAGTILSGLANNAAAHSRNTSTSSFDPYAQIVGPLDAFVLTNGLDEGYIDNETHQSVWLANRAATTGPLLADAAHHGDDVRADTTLELTDQNGRTRAQLIAPRPPGPYRCRAKCVRPGVSPGGSGGEVGGTTAGAPVHGDDAAACGTDG